MLLFYGHFCAHVRLNGPSDLQKQWGKVEIKHSSDVAWYLSQVDLLDILEFLSRKMYQARGKIKDTLANLIGSSKAHVLCFVNK